MRGVLHVHTNFSDGDETLDRVAQTFRNIGMDFIGVSDHAEVFDEQRMQEYAALCLSLSSPTFLIIPGLEFAFKGGSIHILGYGITHRIRGSSMDDVVDGIHASGGIAVLAHPPAGGINMISSIIGKLDGVEVWNGRYDGVRTPRAESFQLLRRVRLSNPKAAAFCGVDFHQAAQSRKPVYVEVDACALTRDEIIDALWNGRFHARGGKLKIPSSGRLTLLQEIAIAVKQPLCRPWKP